MIDPRSPCIIGVARKTWHDQPAPEPLEMWEDVTHHAARDTGVASLLGSIDAIHLVHCMSWSYDDGPRRLADALSISPSFTATSVLAGTAGQRMVNAAAERMMRGESEVALVVGGEALATRRHIRSTGAQPSWRFAASDQASAPIDLDEWISKTEWAHDVLQPTTTFAALDTARRATRGLSTTAATEVEGQLLARLSAIASKDHGAWFPIERSAAEITTTTASNRMISTPYTKYMVAIMDVDMAAALIMVTHEKADELGIPRGQRVYLRGWSFGRDAVHLASRPHLDRSVSMEVASRDALSQAGIGIDDLEYLDLYSCFASSVLFATDALRIDPLGDRSLSVIGGLPYHGGPASNYTTHAIAAMVERLRGRSKTFGLVSGVGMHMTKHVFAVYGSDPGPLRPPDYDAIQREIDTDALRTVVDQVTTPTTATLAAATAGFARTGEPTSALVIVDIDETTRAYGRTTDAEVLELVCHGTAIGRKVTVEPGEHGTNAVTLS